MKSVLRLLITAIAVYVIAHFLPGVKVDGVVAALVVSVVLALLNTFVKPILKLFAFPITLLTLGLFSLVINALIVMLCGYFVDTFHVNGFITALIFSVILSVATWILNAIFGTKD